MKKYIIRTAFVAAFAFMAGYSVYTSQQKKTMSDLALANVEALANGEDWGNPDAGNCTGTFYICESNYDQWWDDAQRNCSSLDVTLVLISGC